MQSTRRLAFLSLLASSPISDDTAGGIRLLDTRALATVTASSFNAVTSLSRQRVRERNSIESDIFVYCVLCMYMYSTEWGVAQSLITILKNAAGASSRCIMRVRTAHAHNHPNSALHCDESVHVCADIIMISTHKFIDNRSEEE